MEGKEHSLLFRWIWMTRITGADGWMERYARAGEEVKTVSMRHEDGLHSYNRWLGPAGLTKFFKRCTDKSHTYFGGLNFVTELSMGWGESDETMTAVPSRCVFRRVVWFWKPASAVSYLNVIDGGCEKIKPTHSDHRTICAVGCPPAFGSFIRTGLSSLFGTDQSSP